MGNAIIDSIGILLSIEVGLDLTNATQLDIQYRKPNGTTGAWQIADGVTYTLDTAKHYVEFTTTSIFQIDQYGTWFFQVYAVGQGFELYGTKAKYKFDNQLIPTP